MVVLVNLLKRNIMEGTECQEVQQRTSPRPLGCKIREWTSCLATHDAEHKTLMALNGNIHMQTLAPNFSCDLHFTWHTR